MRFPISHTFTMTILFKDSRIRAEIDGVYEDEYQYCVCSVVNDKTGDDITDQVSELAINRIEEKACEDYPEVIIGIAETRADMMQDR